MRICTRAVITTIREATRHYALPRTPSPPHGSLGRCSEWWSCWSKIGMSPCQAPFVSKTAHYNLVLGSSFIHNDYIFESTPKGESFHLCVPKFVAHSLGLLLWALGAREAATRAQRHIACCSCRLQDSPNTYFTCKAALPRCRGLAQVAPHRAISSTRINTIPVLLLITVDFV